MIYFDNSATTKPKKEVLDTFCKVAGEFFGNPSSVHHLGLQAEKLLNQAREQVARLLRVEPQEIIFTSGGTEGNNFIIKGVAKNIVIAAIISLQLLLNIHRLSMFVNSWNRTVIRLRICQLMKKGKLI